MKYSKSNKKTVKRGKRKSKRKNNLNSRNENSMFILGANAAGLANKKESFNRLLNLFLPGVFFVQESKLRIRNKMKHPKYITFEYIRKNCGGGGLLTAVHKTLNPVCVSNDTEEEVLVVETKLDGKKVRFINGYGPQDDDDEEVRHAFFNRIDIEVKRAKLSGCFICIEMDANAKLGNSINPGDPKEQSKNGKLLEKVIVENELVLVNAEDVCKGKITRKRQTKINLEESVLDYFICCKNFYSSVTSMIIDEERAYSLTKFSGKTGNKSIKKSGHNILIL